MPCHYEIICGRCNKRSPFTHGHHLSEPIDLSGVPCVQTNGLTESGTFEAQTLGLQYRYLKIDAWRPLFRPKGTDTCPPPIVALPPRRDYATSNIHGQSADGYGATAVHCCSLREVAGSRPSVLLIIALLHLPTLPAPASRVDTFANAISTLRPGEIDTLRPLVAASHDSAADDPSTPATPVELACS